MGIDVLILQSQLLACGYHSRKTQWLHRFLCKQDWLRRDNSTGVCEWVWVMPGCRGCAHVLVNIWYVLPLQNMDVNSFEITNLCLFKLGGMISIQMTLNRCSGPRPCVCISVHTRMHVCLCKCICTSLCFVCVCACVCLCVCVLCMAWLWNKEAHRGV